MKYFTLIISFLFIVFGFIIHFNSRQSLDHDAIGSILFFLLCFLTALWKIYEDIKLKSELRKDYSSIQIQLNTKIYTNKSKFKILLLFLIFLFGYLGYYTRMNIIMNITCILTFFGLVLLFFLYQFNIIGTQYFLIGKDSITLGNNSYEYTLNFSNIKRISTEELSSNHILCFELKSEVEVLDSVSPNNTEYKIKLQNVFYKNISWLRCHLILHPSIYGIQIGLLYRYLMNIPDFNTLDFSSEK